MDLNKLKVNNVSFADYIKTNHDNQINLIVGKNGVGKTRLLEAIAEVVGYMPDKGIERVDLSSFDTEELTELIHDWKNLSKKFPNARGHIFKLLRAAEPDFCDFSYGAYVDELAVELGSQKERVDIYDMSSGFKRVFEICVRAWACENGVLLIDDFELGLHHSIQTPLWEYIIKVAKERKNSVFATTHSGDAILGFAKTTSDSGAVRGLIIRLGHSERQSDTSELVTTTFNEKEFADLYHLGIDVRG